MTSILFICSVLAASAVNLLPEPHFQEELADWRVEAGQANIKRVEMEGEETLHIQVAPNVAAGYPRAMQEFSCQPGAIYEAVVEAKGAEVGGGYGVYMTIEFLDEDKKRLVYFQSNNTEAEADWTSLRVQGIAPSGAAMGMICLLLNGQGSAWFRSPEVILLQSAEKLPETNEVVLRVAPEPLAAPFLGFGHEDDGWFYNEENAAKGVDAAAITQHEERIRFMDPDLVRMFFWYRDWNPSGDWETFTWDSSNMQSHYRALDFYQQIGAAVNVTGVEWGMQAPFAQVEPMAGAITALLEHLIKGKGYSCIKYWTLTNEPNGTFVRTGATFEDYVRLHVLVKEGIEARGLGVLVVGSDDTNGGFAWFNRCVQDRQYFAAADIFASHRYLQKCALPLAGFFMQERVDLLAGRKPFIVAEFGFQDERSGTLENPLMREFDYALWAMRFAIEGLNLGVSGFTIWCLNEVYYPNNWKMTYGLWDYADNHWRLRPVFHAWALLTRRTEPGEHVRQVSSSATSLVDAAAVGEDLFWVCDSDQPMRVRVEGAEVEELRIINEKDDLNLLEAGQVAERSEEMVLPAKSFGVMRLTESVR